MPSACAEVPSSNSQGSCGRLGGGRAVEGNKSNLLAFWSLWLGTLFRQEDHGAHPHLTEHACLKSEDAPHHERPQQVLLEGGAVPHVQPAIGDNDGQAPARLQEPSAVHHDIALRIGQARKLAGLGQFFRSGPQGLHVSLLPAAAGGRIANHRIRGRKSGGEKIAGANTGQVARKTVGTERLPEHWRGVGTGIDAVKLIGEPLGGGAERLKIPGAFQQKSPVAEAHVKNVIVRRTQRPARQEPCDGRRCANEGLRFQSVAHAGRDPRMWGTAFEYHSGGRIGGLQKRRGARTSRPFSGAIQEAGDFLNEACGIFVHRHVAAALHDRHLRAMDGALECPGIRYRHQPV